VRQGGARMARKETEPRILATAGEWIGQERLSPTKQGQRKCMRPRTATASGGARRSDGPGTWSSRRRGIGVRPSYRTAGVSRLSPIARRPSGSAAGCSWTIPSDWCGAVLSRLGSLLRNRPRSRSRRRWSGKDLGCRGSNTGGCRSQGSSGRHGLLRENSATEVYPGHG
jgi:hypothetical protein